MISYCVAHEAAIKITIYTLIKIDNMYYWEVAIASYIQPYMQSQLFNWTTPKGELKSFPIGNACPSVSYGLFLQITL